MHVFKVKEVEVWQFCLYGTHVPNITVHKKIFEGVSCKNKLAERHHSPTAGAMHPDTYAFFFLTVFAHVVKLDDHKFIFLKF